MQPQHSQPHLTAVNSSNRRAVESAGADSALLAQFEVLFSQILAGKASAAAFHAFVATCVAANTIKLTLDPGLLGMVVALSDLNDQDSVPADRLSRYGQENKPIYSMLVYGEVDQPGAAFVRSNGDNAAPTDYSDFNGPPHLHTEDAHLGLIMQGEGRFLLLADTANGRRVLTVPVRRGDLLVIPPGAIHTFWAPAGAPFGVLSLTSKYIPSNTPDFQRYLNAEELAALPPQLNFADFTS